MAVAFYRVYRRPSTDLTWRLIAEPVTSAYTDIQVEPSTTYLYRVTAVDDLGQESAPSSEFTVTTDDSAWRGAKLRAGVLADTARGSGTTATLVRPVLAQAGDVMLWQLDAATQAVTLTVPTGFTLVASPALSGDKMWVLGRVATQSDPASWTATLSGSTEWISRGVGIYDVGKIPTGSALQQLGVDTAVTFSESTTVTTHVGPDAGDPALPRLVLHLIGSDAFGQTQSFTANRGDEVWDLQTGTTVAIGLWAEEYSPGLYPSLTLEPSETLEPNVVAPLAGATWTLGAAAFASMAAVTFLPLGTGVIAPVSINSTVTFGAPTVSLGVGATQTVTATSLGPTTTFGNPAVTLGASPLQFVAPTSLGPTTVFGTATVSTDTTPPPDPATIDVQVSIQGTQAAVSWSAITDPGDFLEYRLYRKPAAQPTYDPVAIYEGTSTGYVDGPLAPGQYSWLVTSVDEGNNESAGTEGTATIGTGFQPKLILDPGANQIDLMALPYGVLEYRFPVQAPTVQKAGAGQWSGQRPYGRQHDNRQITVRIQAAGANITDEIRQLAMRVAKVNDDPSGGELRREFDDGGAITYDLTGASMDVTFDHAYENGLSTIDLTFECLPFARGDEIALGVHSFNSLTPGTLQFVEAGIPGDVPALGRLVVRNDMSSATLAAAFAVWGIRSRTYDSWAWSKLLWTATDGSTGTGSTRTASPSGTMIGSQAVRSATLTSTWRDVVRLNMLGSDPTHVGTYRVFARVLVPAESTGTVSVRLAWEPRSGAGASYNPQFDLATTAGPVETQWVLADLGMVSIPTPRKTQHSWGAVIQAMSNGSLGSVYVDHMLLVPADEGYGEVAFTAASNGRFVPQTYIEIRHDGVLRQRSAASTEYIDAPNEGDLLLVPTAGPNSRQLEVIVKLAVNEGRPLITDIVLGALSAQLHVTPRYLVA